MKFFLDNWMLFSLATASGAMLVWPLVRDSAGSGSIATGEAVRLINREKAVLIDVVEPAEFAAGHAVGARNVPLSQLDGHKALPTNKTLPVLVMCPTGTRSNRAVAQLRKAGYEKAVAVKGGNRAWVDASLPIEKSA